MRMSLSMTRADDQPQVGLAPVRIVAFSLPCAHYLPRRLQAST